MSSHQERVHRFIEDVRTRINEQRDYVGYIKFPRNPRGNRSSKQARSRCVSLLDLIPKLRHPIDQKVLVYVSPMLSRSPLRRIPCPCIHIDFDQTRSVCVCVCVYVCVVGSAPRPFADGHSGCDTTAYNRSQSGSEENSPSDRWMPLRPQNCH